MTRDTLEALLQNLINSGCDDPQIRATAIIKHKLCETNETLFNDLLTTFYGAQIPAGKLYTKEDISTIIGTSSCMTAMLRATADDRNTSSNDDIKLFIEKRDPVASLIRLLSFMDNDTRLRLLDFIPDIESHYSIPLFLGLSDSIANAKYLFYKGKCSKCKKVSIIFKAVNINDETNILYYGDLSDVYP